MSNEKNYKGLGFIEALVSILVTGMASIALMDIAAKTMTDTIRNETTDVMTQYAIEGSEMAQVIADEERVTGEDLFPDSVEYSDNCFLLNEDFENPSFVTGEEGDFVQYSYLDREEYKEAAKMESDDQYFRIFCRTNDYSDKLIVSKIIVGLVNRNTTEEGGTLIYSPGGVNNISDYEYYTIIKL